MTGLRLALFLLLLPMGAMGGELTIQWRQGAPWNASFPLTIEQRNPNLELEIDPKWATEPFRMPYYWDLSLSWEEDDGRSWAIDLMHHKLFLQNPPPEVQYYNHSHGYNLVHLIRGWPWRGLRCGVGAGVVVLHPENRVRGRTFKESGGHLGHGYWISGPSALISVAKDVDLPGPFQLLFELRGNASYVWPQVHDGNSRMGQAALHVLAGIGWVLPFPR